MHGTFIPPNRPLLIVDPWGHYLVDPNMLYVGWDGHVFPGYGNVSTLSRGRVVEATITEDTRRL